MVKFLKLTDAAALQKTAKYTFYRPSERVIAKLKKGNLVKLVFEITGLESNDLLAMLPSAERMWVIITERNGDKFKGTLDNDPYKIQDIKAGDLVEFETKHIIQSDIEEMEFDIVEKYSVFCIVSNKILMDNERIGLLYRNEVIKLENGRTDSGWCFMSGNESEAYLNNPENFTFTTLGKVLNLNDAFIQFLDEPEGSEYCWDDVLKKYMKVNDEL
jgi:hypothetical protein